jgi:hypothetical protein
MAVLKRGNYAYQARPVTYIPKHGRLRTYWRAECGSWNCGHMHRCPETAAECAERLNGGVVAIARRAASK